jgi:glyoxylase-like metal-dependent hydrolase (beta-lactamase superfamily II)
MRTTIAAVASVLLLLAPHASVAQDSKAALEAVAKTLGADQVTSVVYEGSGVLYAVGQAQTTGMAWPKFNVTRYSLGINYDTAASREETTRSRADRAGGGLPAMGEARTNFVVNGDVAWNVVGEAATSAPITLAERQFQLWATPHGMVKAALAGKGSIQGRTITVTMPGRFKADALVNDQGLIDRVAGTIPNAVLGDLPIEITYADYKDFGGVKFPTKIRQTAGGHPSLELTVTDVQPNMVFDAPVPPAVRQAGNPYTRVTSEKVADGVWYVTGGSHHSVLIEMKDYVIVVEGPLNDDRAMAVIMEARNLVPAKPIRYVVASHNHFDHSGGLRAFAALNVITIVHESARPYFERVLAAPATVGPDRLAKSGRSGAVEGVRAKRVISDGTRSVEIHHIAGNLHADDLLMVYLPKEKFLIEADAYTPPAPNAAPMTPPSPFTVNLVENITKQNLTVDQILPLHGRMVPVAELHKAAGH